MEQVNKKFKSTVIISSILLIVAIIPPIISYFILSDDFNFGIGLTLALFFFISSAALALSGLGALIASYFLIKKGGWKASSTIIKVGYILICLSLISGIPLVYSFFV
jgi:hypothetical protein